MTTHEKALEAAWAVYHGSTNDQRGALADAITAYLSALLPEDAAGIVRLLGALAVDFECDDERAAKDTVDRAVSLIQSQAARIAELEAGLDPFDDASECLEPTDLDHYEIWEHPAAMNITAGHLRAARRALTGGKNG